MRTQGIVFLLALGVFLLIWCTCDFQVKPLLHNIEGDTSGNIRILTPAGSSGTDTDARIYRSLLPTSYIVFVDADDPDSHLEAGKKVQINLYVEDPGASTKFPADQNWLMVNHEMLSWSPFLREVDLFLCKTWYATQLLQNLKRQKNLKGKVLYTKHTSRDCGFEPNKDWNLFVHFAGKSWLKQTDAVLRAWIDNKGFPDLGYPKLVVTCRDRCLTESVLKLLNDFDIRGTSIKYPNIQVKSFISDEEYSSLQRKAGVYLCPSLTEGYGHYLNEGRSSGAVIITVDGKPMNELVDKTNGILIPALRYPSGHELGSPDRRLEGSFVYLVSSKDIEKAVRKYYLLSDSQKISMSQKSRERYLEDTHYLSKVFENLRYPFS